MLKSFFKYQSLGNDFIVFDWYNESEKTIASYLKAPTWSNVVKKMCERHTGIGADGVLVLKKNIVRITPIRFSFNFILIQICCFVE